MSSLPFAGETPSQTLASSSTAGTLPSTAAGAPGQVPTLNAPAASPSAAPVNPDHLTAVANAAPTLSPSETIGVASSSASVADAAVRAQAVAASNLGSKLTDLFHKLDDASQTRLWAQVSPSLKALMVSQGYKAPTSIPQAASGGWWNDAVHFADDARHAVSAVGNVARTALVTDPSRAFNAAFKPINDLVQGAILNAKQASISSYESGDGLWSPGAIARTLDPVSILRAYNSVYSGKASFAPEALMYVQRQLGVTGAKLQIAQAVAKGATLQQVLLSIPQSQRPQVATMLQQDHNFKQAVSVLSDSGLSLGQVLFGGLNPTEMAQVFPRYGKGYFGANQVAAGALGVAGTVGMVASGNPEGAGATFAEGLGVRGASALALGGAETSGVAKGLLTGQTADQATRARPFGKVVNPLSGTVDGLVNWYANPLNRGLQFTHIAHDVERSTALMNAMGDSKSVEYLYANSPKYVRFAKTVATALTKDPTGLGGVAERPNFAELEHMGIDPAGLEEQIKAYWPEIKAGVEQGTPESGVARMLADNQGKINLLRGRWANTFRDSSSLPYLTLRQETIDRILGVGKRGFQGDRFDPRVGIRQTVKAIGAQRELEDARMLEAADPTAKLGVAARMGRRITNEVPVGPLDLTAPNAATKVQQLARLALPERQVADVYNQFLDIPAAEIGARRALVYSVTREVMRNLGVGDSRIGAKFLDDWETHQHYAADGADLMADPLNPDGPGIPVALDPSQTSSMVALPKWAELYQFARKSRMMRLFNIGLNNRGFDYFMSRFWKRSMLFRTAFGIRFASEEALNFLLRNGAGAYLQSRLAASATNAANTTRDALLERAGQAIQASGDTALHAYAEDLAAGKGLVQMGEDAAAGSVKSINELDAHVIAHALFADVPTPILKAALEGEPDTARGNAMLNMRVLRNKVFNPAISMEDLRGMMAGGVKEQDARLMAASLSASSISWLDKVQMRIAGDRLMNAAFNLAKRGVLGSAMQDQIDSITAHGNVFTGDNAVAQDVHELIKTADGNPIRISANSGFSPVSPEDPEIYVKYAVSLGQLASGTLTRPALDAFSKGGYEGQIQAVEDAIKRPDLVRKLDEAQAKLDAAVADGAKHEAIDGLTQARDTHKAALEAHVASMERIPRYRQLPDGTTVASGLTTQDETIRAWAQAVVDHVNATVMTDKPQELDKEGEPIEPNGPQPIRLREAPVPRHPFEVEIGPGKHFVDRADAKHPYRNLPDGNVRLFKSLNVKTLEHTGTELPNPGRAWFPSYQDAANRAAEDGVIYQVDIPREELHQHGVLHAATTDTGLSGTFVGHMESLQRAGDVPAGVGHLDLGNMHFGPDVEKIPNLLIDRLARGAVPSPRELSTIPIEHIPGNFVAPQLVASVSRNAGKVMDDFMEKGMEQLVGRPANYMARQPIFLYNYARALDDAQNGLRIAKIADADGELAHDIAMERAANDTIPFIHNPASKSQFSVITRNLMPFWFAQEQFYKRWARLFGAYPEAWYKLSLAMTGLSHVGFVYTDQYGQAAFTYPGSEYMMNVLRHVPGLHALPIGVGFSTEVAQLNPTTALGGMPVPSFGPLVTIPTDFAAVLFPGLVPLAQGLRGPNAPTFNEQGNWFDQVIQEIMPSIVNRAMEWYTVPTGDASTQGIASPIFMSSAIEAMKLMELSGHGLTEAQLKSSESTTLQQQYLDRLANWTKNIIGLRALFGFFSPGTPNFVFNDQGLGNELNTYLATMNYKDAIATFMKLHPNATAMDLFASTTDGTPGMPGSGSGAYVPASTPAMNYINANLTFFKNYPGLAPWTIPPEAAKGLFNGTAYQEEKNLNLREPRTLTDAYMQMKYSEGANIYYPVDDLFKAAQGEPATLASLDITQAEAQQQLGLTSGMSNTQIKQIWEKWSANFQATHPLFAAQLTMHGVEAAARRTNIVSQLQDAINRGDLPENEWTKAIGPLMQGYAEVQSFANQTKGNTAATAQRVDNYNAFVQWGTQYAKLNPVVAPFWNGVLMAQIPK